MNDPIQIIYENCVLKEMAFGLGPGAIPITHDELLNKIVEAEAQGSVPISVTMVTVPSNQVKAKNNEFYPIYKVSQTNGILGAHYEDAVNRQREREGATPDFKRTSGWGKHLSRSIVQGPNGIGIQIQPTDTGVKRPPVYIGTQGDYMNLSYIPLTKEQWSPLVPQYSRPLAQQLQGVKKDVLIIRPNLKNIVGCSLLGKEFTISTITQEQKNVLAASGIV